MVSSYYDRVVAYMELNGYQTNMMLDMLLNINSLMNLLILNLTVMVKKLLIMIVAVLGISTAAMAKDTYARDASVLPKAAQTMIANNFKANVSVVKIESDFGRVSEYEVVLTDGTEISFDRDGNWDNVEVGEGSIPKAFIPQAIADYVKANQPGQKIVGIEKERHGYDVELSNGIEMKFDKNGKFQRYDD